MFISEPSGGPLKEQTAKRIKTLQKGKINKFIIKKDDILKYEYGIKNSILL